MYYMPLLRSRFLCSMITYSPLFTPKLPLRSLQFTFRDGIRADVRIAITIFIKPSDRYVGRVVVTSAGGLGSRLVG